MKRIIFLTLTIAFYTTALWSQNWTGFGKSEPAEPEINVTRSDNQQVSFTVQTFGFYSKTIKEAGVNYQRLSIPDCGVTDITGEPEIPVINKRIAVPECSSISYTVQITAYQTLSNYRVYPSPELQQNSNDVFEEVFFINPLSYQQNSFIPEVNYNIAETGSLRNQRFVSLDIFPIQFNPVTNQLTVNTEITVTLTFNNPTTDVNVNTGIFNNVATHTFLNYQDSGIKASINDKAFEKDGFTQGKVKWINITDTSQADTIVADYIIICAGVFFDSHCSEVQRIADFRSWYNGFDVAIVNVEHIISDDVGFYFEGTPNDPADTTYKKEQRIRTFLRLVYEGQNAAHVYDGHLAYVLLIGDVDEGNMGMPTSYQSGNYGDYCYSCITRNSTNQYAKVGSLFVGRFCVPNDLGLGIDDGITRLSNIVTKTINMESEFTFGGWRNNVHAGNSTSINFPANGYFTYMNNLLHNQNFTFVSTDYIASTEQFKIELISMLNEGAPYFGYHSHGNPDRWTSPDISADFLMNSLENNFKTPFCSTTACLVGKFDWNQGTCLAEQMTTYSSEKGFVAIMSSLILRPSEQNSAFYVPKAIYQYLSHITGEIWLGNVLSNGGCWDLNFLGDPALNIMAQGFEVTRDITVENITNISCHVNVRNGATLTIPSSGTLNFQTNGKLIIESDGNLVIGANTQINGSSVGVTNAIHVNGGNITIGTNTTFQNLNGIFLENGPINNSYSIYDDNKLFLISNVTFNNSPIYHSGCKLNMSNCTFNQGSNVLTIRSKSNIDGCVFNKTKFISDQSFFPSNSLFGVSSTTIKNSKFTGTSSSNAIQIDNSASFVISGNEIKNYEKGIYLSSSGTTLSYNDGLNMIDAIYGNKVSGCDYGVVLLNSVANFRKNTIFSNWQGVHLLNNSYSAFNYIPPYIAPMCVDQSIKLNSLYQLYTAANSFPTVFKWNEIIGSPSFMLPPPLIYWDVTGKVLVKNISYNYWGDNGSYSSAPNLYPSGVFNILPVWNPCTLITVPADPIEMSYQSGLDYFATGDYINAGLTFKELIETKPESQFAVAAMHELLAVEKATNNDFTSLRGYFSSFTPADSTLFDVADFLAARCNVIERQWQPAIDWYENRIANPPSYPDSIFAVIDLGDIHLRMEADTAGLELKSKLHFSYRFPNIKPKSKLEYENTKSTLLATLPQKKQSQTQQPASGKNGQLKQNVPNPAAENSTFFYELFSEGNVEMKIFNVLGQEVLNVPLNKKQRGTHQTVVSLENIPEGTYEYVLFVDGVMVDAKKMIKNKK